MGQDDFYYTALAQNSSTKQGVLGLSLEKLGNWVLKRSTVFLGQIRGLNPGTEEMDDSKEYILLLCRIQHLCPASHNYLSLPFQGI